MYLGGYSGQIVWQGKPARDPGCAGCFMAEALAGRGAQVNVIAAAAAGAITAACARAGGLRSGKDVSARKAVLTAGASA